MDSVVENKMVVRLSLSIEEAQWLKAVVQNPQDNLKDENEQDSTIRRAFWRALTHVPFP